MITSLFTNLWKRWKVFAALGLLLIVSAPLKGATLSHFPSPVVTAVWSEFYGTIRIDGVDAQPGDEIAFYDPGGILCGSYQIQRAGEYGIVHVYGDDTTTSGVDEGASPGELLSVRIWDSRQQIELSGGTLRLSGGVPLVGSSFSSSPVPPVWQDRTGYVLNLDTTSHFPEPVHTPRVSNFAGSLTISGSPATVGDEVAVYDPDGVLCGHFRVSQPGFYGAVQVYGDDWTTSEDEGATEGDLLTFKVWQRSTNTEYTGNALALTAGAAQGSFVPALLPPRWQVDVGSMLDIDAEVVANRPPVATDGAVQTAANTPVTGTLSATDPDIDPLTFRIITNGSKGTATITDATTGAFSYLPFAGESGPDAFTFVANDGTADSNTATISVTITAIINNPPVAMDSAVQTPANTPVTGTLSATDPDIDPLTFRIITNGTKGTATITDATTGAFSYLPFAGESGPDAFTFVANDGTHDSNTATISVTIAAAVNNPPVAANKQVFTVANTPVTLTVNANDPDGDPLTYRLGSTDPRTIIRVYFNGSLPNMHEEFSGFIKQGHLGQIIVVNAATGEFTYTPDPDASGTDFFIFDAFDGVDHSKPAFIIVTINRILMGDINRDGFVNLGDAILALQISSAINVVGADHTRADVNGDGKIGLPEAIYILQDIASLR